LPNYKVWHEKGWPASSPRSLI